jgi:endonuclease/exonuclease/phosphatase family metal-dependent hydrolase
MRISSIGPAPSRRWVEHACALVAATGLLLPGSLFRAVPAQAQTSATLKLMDWNIHHGLDTSGANNLERVVGWIVKVNPHVVSLNEVEKQNGYTSNADQPAVLESALESRTGSPWYGCFAQREGDETGQGNLVLSRIPLGSCHKQLLSAARSVARATLSVNNLTVAVSSTHLDDASASTRASQVAELISGTATSPVHRILMGDFNASANATELAQLKIGWEDAWAVAAADGTEVSYSGNTAGNTRNGRIDYIWRSKGAAKLILQSAQVYETGAISDHRPVSATYAVTNSLTMTPPSNLRFIGR